MSPFGSRRMLALGALFTVLGLAIAATSPMVAVAGPGRPQAQSLTGGMVVLVGWALLVWGVHRFGREPPGERL